MKTIFLIRHAKSSWELQDGTDFSRELDEKGHQEAQEMASIFMEYNPKIDKIISSSAKRTVLTSEYFANAINYKVEDIEKFDELYHAPKEIMLYFLTNEDDTNKTICLIGHNPGISNFIRSINSINFNLNDMPTCGMVKLKCDTENWKEVSFQNLEIVDYKFPKN